MSKKLVAIKHAIERFEHTHGLALAGLERHESRACLEAFCELMGLYVECTGGTLVTAALRAQLADIQTRVAGVSHLRAMPAVEAETTGLDFKLQAADQCACGEHVTVQYVYAGVFEVRCARCYDPGEDSGELSNCRAHGPTPEAALTEWRAAQDLIDPGPELWPNDIHWQARVEYQRQAGWVQTVTAQGVWFAPEILEGHAPELHNCATK